MNRRTFLKGVFVAAVTPASCVRALYRPAIAVEWARFETTTSWTIQELKFPTYGKECRETIHHLENLMREDFTVTTWQPPKGV